MATTTYAEILPMAEAVTLEELKSLFEVARL